MVVHFPVALWMTIFLFDWMAWRRDEPTYRRAAYWLVGLGLLTAAIGIAAGWVDFLAYQRAGGDAKFAHRHWLHSAPAYAATALYLANFLWRWRTNNRLSGALLTLSMLGAILIAATGYLGGVLRESM
jgi:uncharacterized membrane protein